MTQLYRTSQFHIEELDCAEEVLQLRSVLVSQTGIHQLEFDVLNARMTVEFDPAATTDDQILTQIASTGMHATLWEENRLQDEKQSWWQTHHRTVYTSVAGLLTGSAALVSLLGPGNEPGLQYLSQFLYALAIIAGLRFVLPKAYNSLVHFRTDMNLLMTVAIIGAIILGEWLEAAMVSFLFALSLLLEHWSMGRARRAIASLLDLTPEMARCVADDNGQATHRERPVAEVPPGTTILVRPGEKIPLDGVVLSGESTVNEAPITGESVPHSKQAGDDVFAGTLNQNGTLTFRTTKNAESTTLARIVQMVQDAQARRAPSEQWVESFARYYTPCMMFLALCIAIVPPLLLSQAWNIWFFRALVLLVIACPCALVISTPVSIVSALTAAAGQGVLIKGGRYLEAIAQVKVLAVDKTGTLTFGRPVVQQVFSLNGHSEREVLERAAALETDSSHPLALAIRQRATEHQLEWEPAQEYRIFQGKGAEGIFDGRRFWIGSHRFLHERVEEPPEVHEQALALEDSGHSVVAVGNDDHICGLITIADKVRDDVGATLADVRSRGVNHIAMLTGDNRKTANEVARQVSIDDCRSELLPEDKLREVEALTLQHGPVAMIGDGVNDAPAMAAASLGIAMGAIGTDTAIETADIALMADDLSKLPWLIGHARRTRRIIQQNIAFALGLKLVFVILSVFGLATLWMAIAADTGASLLVIFNGLRLLRA